MNFYSMEQADRMVMVDLASNHSNVRTGIEHQKEYYNPTCRATIPEIFIVRVNGEVVDKRWTFDQAKKSLANHK